VLAWARRRNVSRHEGARDAGEEVNFLQCAHEAFPAEGVGAILRAATDRVGRGNYTGQLAQLVQSTPA